MIGNFVKDSCSLLGGFATIPFNVVIHESGHYIASKLICEGGNPEIYLKGLAWMGSYVSGTECDSSQALLGYHFTSVVISAGGPLLETIAVFATTKLIGGKNIAIAALPHIAHMTAYATSPLWSGYDGDFSEIISSGGAFMYAVSLIGTLAVTGSIIHQIFKKYPASEKRDSIENTLKVKPSRLVEALDLARVFPTNRAKVTTS